MIEIEEVKTLHLKPGDILVIRHPGRLGKVARERIREIVEQTFPGHKALVLEEGMQIDIVAPEVIV